MFCKVITFGVKMTEELKHILIKPILKQTVRNKVTCYLTNKTIILSLTIIAFIIIISYLNIKYNYLTPVITLIATSLLTLFLLTIWETYNSLNYKNALFTAFTEEITGNLVLLLENNNKLNNELNMLNNDKKSGYFRLKKIKLNIFEVLKHTFPEELFNLGFTNINQYISISQDFNHTIIYKEKLTFKATHKGEQADNVIKLDEELKIKIKKLIKYICILCPNIIIFESKDGINFKEIKESKNLTNMLNKEILILIGE